MLRSVKTNGPNKTRYYLDMKNMDNRDTHYSITRLQVRKLANGCKSIATTYTRCNKTDCISQYGIILLYAQCHTLWSLCSAVQRSKKLKIIRLEFIAFLTSSQQMWKCFTHDALSEVPPGWNNRVSFDQMILDLR